VHDAPADAHRLGLTDGGLALVSSKAGKIEVPVEVADEIRPGVVSIPHRCGHGLPGTKATVAAAHSGVDANLVADATLLDALSGTAVLNGIPVEVAPTGAEPITRPGKGRRARGSRRASRCPRPRRR
jgi:anaerobic selenocysteine-containing dehydrogenase